MSSLARNQISALLLIVLGLGLVASVVVFMPHAGQEKYYHEVQPAADHEVPEASYLEVVEYADLPPSGKDVFQAAMHSSEGYVVYGTANVPEEWHYPTDTGPQPIYVEYEGSYYELLIQGESFEVLSGYVAGFVAFLGIVFTVLGGWWYLDKPVNFDGRRESGVAVAGIVGFVGLALDFLAGIDPLPFVVAGVALGAVVVTTGMGVRDADDS